MALPHTPEDSPLGKPVSFDSSYDPSLLYPIERAQTRDSLGLGRTVPFFGIDIWNAYELSWLNLRGKPQVGILSVTVPADSPNIIESKSFKLYLNSLAQAKLAGKEALCELLRADLSAGFGAPVQVAVSEQDAFAAQNIEELDGLLLDRLDIEADEYQPNLTFLHTSQDEPPVEEKLVSHLLKSNCPVTGQPDWASLQIHYVGFPINQEGLLKYLISLRSASGFHEQCVERIFMDLLRQCKPTKLAVYARFTRRGGIDINPWRSNFTTGQYPSNARHARQ
ncbi:MAG: NADPH-dependent 7-cyano-7-deazaguanine reductase QueF [Burkholderiaceae bacterium]|nr:NADPH-dependent 7-cyano-7-deazaguanine reductase QueF [Burkholderiaceae bacterium]